MFCRRAVLANFDSLPMMNFFITAGKKTRCLRSMMNTITLAERGDHISLTANQPRQDVLSKALVVDMKMLSPTVKKITLKIEHHRFSFKAGQWVDVTIPGVPQIGGFSIASSPWKLHDKGLIDLAVKFARYPPAYWLHEHCEVGNEVQVRSGGEFFCESSIFRDSPNVLLVGGGVGINPLASIYQYCADLHRSPLKENLPGKVLLLFSACNYEELLFRDTFSAISQEIPSIQTQFFVTQESCPAVDDSIARKRINHQHLKLALEKLGKRTVCYICGPTSMLTDVDNMLLDLGVEGSRIRYEKWW